jgi:hypothetical protein
VVAVAEVTPPAPNVILLTLDGVRWEEVFHGVDQGQSLDSNPGIFTYLLNTLSKQGVLYGDKTRGETVSVANKPQNSLPAYQSIMAGATQPCGSNLCGRINVETLPERLLMDLNLKPEQVATIASWEKIALAAEHNEGTTFVNAGNRAFKNADEVDAKINKEQAENTPPWKDARYDEYTIAHALHYLKKNQPRFMFISLNDSDEWGHKGNYGRYVSTLRQHDGWIKELVSTLDSMGQYGKNTTLIVTTDHGRGDGNDWNEHGSGYADSKSIWLFGRSPYSISHKGSATRVPASQIVYTHLDIRPTIEATFGLTPKMDGVTPPPGKVIESITGPRGKLKASL